MPYLYGSSIQGIQSFIFETSKLREIAGASELIEELCGRKDIEGLVGDSSDRIEWLLNAAGNIRFTTDDTSVLASVVAEWPKFASTKAPGITVSQAVVRYDGTLQSIHFDELENNLRIQRNFSPPSDLPGIMAIERNRRTGKPAISNERIDRETKANLEVRRSSSELMNKLLPEGYPRGIDRFPFEISDITGTSDSNWIAVIHADGNDLGKTIRNIGRACSENGVSMGKIMREFSSRLEAITKKSSRIALGSVFNMEDSENTSKKYPVRPVIIGGDDITVICRADLALEFTKKFLEEFRIHSKEDLGIFAKENMPDSLGNGLSACAGIAFIKDHYPFHYAVDLATSLCDQAKKRAKSLEKEITPSCLMFHKVQSSFVDDYEQIAKRELEAEKVSFDVGPYYIDNETPEGSQNIGDLLEAVDLLNKSDSPSPGLRRWLSALYRSKDHANQLMTRLMEIKKGYAELLKKAEIEERDGKICSPVYHWLTVASMTKTKGDN